jgi:nucleotide-binding universal stress UspA family protein
MSAGVTRSRILVGVDESSASDAAVRWAAREAAMRSLPLTLLHVVAPSLVSSAEGPTDDAITQAQLNRARRIVDTSRELVDRLTTGTPLDVHTQVQYAGITPTLVEESTHAWMVVVGSRGLDAVEEHLLGSVSAGLIHHAHCPVAIVHERQSARQEIREEAPVLVGIDGSPASEAATALAFDEACRRGVPLVALHAWSDVGVFPILGMDPRKYRDEGAEALSERLAGWQERYPDVHVQRRLVCDVPAKWLIEESKNAQLVIVGSRRRGGPPEKHLGSVSHTLARSVQVPVIVTPVEEQAGFDGDRKSQRRLDN